MKNKQYSESRKTYFINVLTFLCLLGAVVSIYIVFAAVNAPPEPEGYVMDRAMTAHVPGKGTFYMEPDLLVYCGKPPAPMDWNFFTDDGTIDENKVIEFSKVLTKWDECAEEYATIIRAYAASTDMLRDVITGSAASFFLEFAPEYAPDHDPDMGDELLEHDGLQPGTFQCDTCHDNLKR